MKRIIDLSVALVILLLAMPLMVFVALLIRYRLGSPVLYKQQRPGRYGKPFGLYKFRSMSDNKDASGILLPDELRLTSFGKFIRSTSIDELPQFINILKGDLSLVGPRPLLMEYLSLYTKEQHRRHDVKPGITGWAQINGRNGLTWETKFEHDLWYVDHHSLKLDFYIMLRTINIVVRRENVANETHVTMPKFTGNANRLERDL
ncbi:hypothetical protein SY83_02695 [Paenibacillus swuensis]|uniref:Bacterial sugar transferase domain-containing protein n=1 Tax=Paenibacillus swuensis TaxID=1178515 RepID=A0A172TEE8_9BACL|nr:sugar transferase [Paenibacillus swuensis]ANE45411.1 hypothetical protein SY83_02695 [Paenibacillus swuensis]